jgi:hypothetical protein
LLVYGSSAEKGCGTRQVHGCAGCDVEEVEEARRDGSWNKQEEPQQAWKRGVEEDHGREGKKRISRIV